MRGHIPILSALPSHYMVSNISAQVLSKIDPVTLYREVSVISNGMLPDRAILSMREAKRNSVSPYHLGDSVAEDGMREKNWNASRFSGRFQKRKQAFALQSLTTVMSSPV